MIKNKKILITGGAGFIGSRVAERLYEHNEVVLLDTVFGPNTPYSWTPLNGKVACLTESVVSYEQFKRTFEGVQICVHCAAVLGVKNVMEHPKHTLETNINGTLNVLKAFTEYGNPERFVFFSTSEIFGENAFKVEEGSNTFLKGINDVRWCYAISKIAGEHLTLSYYREEKLPAVIVRPFNVYGPGRLGDHVMKRFILQALRDENITIYQDGSQIRSWCYIDDFVDAVLQTMELGSAVGEAFNIGNPLSTLTVYALAEKIRALTQSKSQIVFLSPDITDIDLRIPDINKAKNILNFSPKVYIEEGLRHTINWYRNMMGNGIEA